MNYRSVSDLGRVIRENSRMIPSDVDLVVGVPRGGGLAGTMVALSLNVFYLDLASFVHGQCPRHGFTRHPSKEPGESRDFGHVLIVDDWTDSGTTIKRVKQVIAGAFPGKKISYISIYASSDGFKHVDLWFEIVGGPVIFQWNLARSGILADCCIDIDGVLCKDPTREQNDGDGPSYRRFLKEALPLSFPSHEIGYLVTSRLERYRSQTEDWLAKQGIRFKNLHMLDLPDAATRGRLQAQARFKAEVFMSYPGSPLFVESCRKQSHEIATRSLRPVLCIGEQKIYTAESPPPFPGPVRRSRLARILGLARKLASEMSYERVRQWNVMPMQYRSYADLSRTVCANLHKIPGSVDLVVGIPRSGLLAGNLIALARNLPLNDLDRFVNNRWFDQDLTGLMPATRLQPSEVRHVLVVDDTIYRGKSMAHSRSLIEQLYPHQQVTYCAVYAHPSSQHLVDIHLESLVSPGCQEWNFLHRDKAGDFCLEMEGVLCEAPEESVSRDLELYREFCASAGLLFRPTYPVGWIVTARPEALRGETEAWLKEMGIRYEALHMLPPTTNGVFKHETPAARFKASVYASKRQSLLFIEAESKMAKAISAMSGKTVLSFGDQEIFNPDTSKAYVRDAAIRIRNKVKRRLRKVRFSAKGLF